MRLISIGDWPNRTSSVVATDLDLVEFAKYLYFNYGASMVIVHVVDMSEGDMRKWQLEGLPTLTKQQLRIQRATGAAR